MAEIFAVQLRDAFDRLDGDVSVHYKAALILEGVFAGYSRHLKQ